MPSLFSRGGRPREAKAQPEKGQKKNRGKNATVHKAILFCQD
jgi:hypothetical protein